MIIKIASNDDIDDVWDVHQKSGLSPFLYSGFCEWFNRYEVWIARSEANDLCGFLIFSNAGNELLCIATTDNKRNHGIATALLRNILHIKPTCFLEVSQHNFPAINLYTKLGFTQIGIRKNYYGVNDDALVLQAGKI